MAMSFWSRFFGREENIGSKHDAITRVKLAVWHDRMDMSEQDMNALREDLIAVIAKYLVIDEKALEVTLSREDEGVALVANIPILNVRRMRREDTPPPLPVEEKKPEPAKKPNSAKNSAKGKK